MAQLERTRHRHGNGLKRKLISHDDTPSFGVSATNVVTVCLLAADDGKGQKYYTLSLTPGEFTRLCGFVDRVRQRRTWGSE